MFEWVSSLFQGAVAELVFLAICIGCGIITGFTLLFGGDHDHDVGHDGGVDGHDSDHGDGHQGPSFFSIRGLTLFGTGFGGVGYLVQHFTGKTLVASVSGLASGVVLAMAGLAFIRMFFQQQASSLVSDQQIVGTIGSVITSIPEGGMGEVEFNAAGVHTTRAATSLGGRAISRGAPVKIIQTVGHLVIVQPISQ